MKDVLTIESFRNAVKVLIYNNVPPGIVKSKAQAARMTRQDKAFMAMFGREGRKWEKGDKYYICCIFNGGEHYENPGA
jgi:hypothetical protein